MALPTLIPSLPAWDFYNWGLTGSDELDPDGLIMFPGLDRLAYADTNWLCMAQERAGGKGIAIPTRLAHGFLRGQIDLVAWLIGAPADLGVLCLCTDPTMEPGGGGQGYAFCVSTVFSVPRLLLLYLPNGLANSPYQAGGSSALLIAEAEHADIPALGPMQRFRLQWEIDPVELGAIHLACWAGRFDVLTKVIDVCWYGPQAWIPTTAGTEAFYFAGSSNVSAGLFTSCSLWRP